VCGWVSAAIVAREGAQLQGGSLGRMPSLKRHSPGILSQHLSVGEVGLAAAQRSREAIHHLRLQNRHVDSVIDFLANVLQNERLARDFLHHRGSLRGKRLFHRTVQRIGKSKSRELRSVNRLKGGHGPDR
jgi:hypothetical protein